MPSMEFKRVESLRNLNILDTPPESDLDEITQLAGLICKAPIALISLIDTNRQWFKSKIGLDATETPRDISFCDKAIQQKDIFIVGDAALDARFAKNPLVLSSPHIRFYAGAPLTSNQGFALGTLCVIDTVPRELSEEQILSLRILAKQVVVQIEMRQLNRDLQSSLLSLERQNLQIIENQKLSSLGEMVSALAHEINNPLAIIYGRAIHLQEVSATSKVSLAEVHRYATKITEVTERLMGIIKGLRKFTHGGEQSALETRKVSSIINETLEFCRQKIKDANIQLIFPDQDVTAMASCRPVQISQIILNLLNNSIDAVKDLPKPWIRMGIQQTENEVIVSVTDCGNGIDKTVQENLFRPFFTTKDVHGTGLGLNVSKKMAEDQGGTLAYDPSSPQTRFILTLKTNHISEHSLV